jgi:hypothetical protein
MTAIRSYKKALPLTEARAELTRCAGTHFSPDVVRAMLNVSIGRLRSSMGVFAVIAHIPFLGQIAKATSYAPDTVSTAAGMTVTGATTGVSVLALSGGLAMASTASATPPVPHPAPTAFESGAQLQSISATAVIESPMIAPDPTTSLPENSSVQQLAPLAVVVPATFVTETIPTPPVPTDLVAQPSSAETVPVAPAESSAAEPTPTPAPAEDSNASSGNSVDDNEDNRDDNSGPGSKNRGKGGGNSGHDGGDGDNSGEGGG